jgi:hypothetical protein
MSAVWGPLTLLQPSPAACLPETRQLQEAGLIEVLFPAMENPGALLEALEAFEQWAAQHAGSDLGILLEQRRNIPFFDSQSSSRIVTEIRAGGKDPLNEADEEARQALFKAQLFLLLAQKFDRQQAELAREIAALASKEYHMMALLKGEDGVGRTRPGTALEPADRGLNARMDLRMKAWARVMTAAAGTAAPGPSEEAEVLFLTDCPDVIVQAGELFPQMDHRLECRLPLPEGSRPELAALPDWLAEPLRRSAESAELLAPMALGIDLFEIPAMPVEAFLMRLSTRRPYAASTPSGKASPVSCWMGCMTLREIDRGEGGSNRDNI